MSKFIGIIVGSIEIVAGIILAVTGFGAALAPFLIMSGIGMLIAGVGTLISGGAGGSVGGASWAVRNPIAPWQITYGRAVAGGIVVYIQEFGNNGDNTYMYLDMVIVLAAHSCQSVDRLLFDKQFVQLSTAKGPWNGVTGDSFSPVQQTVNIIKIIRANDVVTVTLFANIPLLQPGDKIQITSNAAGMQSFIGRWPVSQIVTQTSAPGEPGTLTFTYVSGGQPIEQDFEGQCLTLWPDYGAKIHMEVMLGTQTLGTTFPGMLYGTPNDGDPGDLVVNVNNPWTANCSLVGKTCVFLRLHYDQKVFSGGLPSISFLIHGKNDIYDPRSGLRGYTENAALVIADYLSNQTFGFKAAYGTEIPNGPLATQANMCDEDVPLATEGGTPYATGTVSATHGSQVVNGAGTAWIAAMAGGVIVIEGFPCTIEAVEAATQLVLLENFGGATGSGLGYSMFYGAGTEPRYTCNGSFDLSVGRGTVLRNLLTACGGRLTYTGGQFQLWVAAWYGSSPAPAPGVGQMSGPIRWKGISVRDLYNGVKGVYISPANNWHVSDIPPYMQDTTHGYTGGDQNLAADGGDRRWLDMQLPFTISAATAQRLCKIELLRRRHQGTATFQFNMVGYQFSVMDVIQMDLPILGWTGKYLEILQHRFVINRAQEEGGQETISLGTEIDVQETDASVYDWSPAEELSPEGYQQPFLPDPFSPAAPTGLTLESDASTAVVTASGIADAILVSWDPTVDGYVLQGGWIEIQYQETRRYLTGAVTINPASGGSVLPIPTPAELDASALSYGYQPPHLFTVWNWNYFYTEVTGEGTSQWGPDQLYPGVPTNETDVHTSTDYVNALTAYFTGGLNGVSKGVTGIGTDWNEDMAGGSFLIGGATYTIESVTGPTALLLTTVYTGAGTGAQPYSITYPGPFTGLPSVNPTVTQVVIHGVDDGALYNVQIRAVNAGGFPSAWVSASIVAAGANLPAPWIPNGEPYPWARSGFTFAMNPEAAGGIAIIGSAPVNVLSTAAAAPVIDPVAFVAPHAGNALPVMTGIIQVFAIDAAGRLSPGSDICHFTTIEAASRISFGVAWTAGTVGYQVYLGPDPDSLVGMDKQGTLPATINIDAFPADYPGSFGPPNPRAVKIRARGKHVWHGGIQGTNIGDPVQLATSITIPLGVAKPLAEDALVGRYLINISPTVPASFGHAILGPITASDTGAPLCTVTIDGVFPDGLPAQPNDLVLVSTLSDTNTGTSIGDSGFLLFYGPTGENGLPVNNVGEIARIWRDPTGVATGAIATVLSNDATVAQTTQFRLPDSTPVTPGKGSQFSFESATFAADVSTSVAANAISPVPGTPGTATLVTLPLPPLQGDPAAGMVILIKTNLQDMNENDAIDTTDNLRMIFVPPVGGIFPGPAYDIPVIDVIATPDLSQGLDQWIYESTDVLVAQPINYPAGGSANWTLTIYQTIGGQFDAVRPSYQFTATMTDASSPIDRTGHAYTQNRRERPDLAGRAAFRELLKTVPETNTESPLAKIIKLIARRRNRRVGASARVHRGRCHSEGWLSSCSAVDVEGNRNKWR